MNLRHLDPQLCTYSEVPEPFPNAPTHGVKNPISASWRLSQGMGGILGWAKGAILKGLDKLDQQINGEPDVDAFLQKRLPPEEQGKRELQNSSEISPSLGSAKQHKTKTAHKTQHAITSATSLARSLEQAQHHCMHPLGSNA
eukprot:1638182-Amphidinium_carterae.1